MLSFPVQLYPSPLLIPTKGTGTGLLKPKWRFKKAFLSLFPSNIKWN